MEKSDCLENWNAILEHMVNYGTSPDGFPKKFFKMIVIIINLAIVKFFNRLCKNLIKEFVIFIDIFLLTYYLHVPIELPSELYWLTKYK